MKTLRAFLALLALASGLLGCDASKTPFTYETRGEGVVVTGIKDDKVVDLKIPEIFHSSYYKTFIRNLGRKARRGDRRTRVLRTSVAANGDRPRDGGGDRRGRVPRVYGDEFRDSAQES